MSERDILDANRQQITEQQLPSLRDIPERERKVLALKAHGLSNVAVADVMGVSEGTIRNIIKQYDPEHKLIVSENTKKAFLAHQLLGLINEALGTIDPMDIKGMSAKERVSFAKTASAVLKDLEYSQEDARENVSDLLKGLENDA